MTGPYSEILVPPAPTVLGSVKALKVGNKHAITPTNSPAIILNSSKKTVKSTGITIDFLE